MWEWILAFLAWLAADPRAIDQEQPRAAAAVAAAYASLADEGPAPAPAPKDCVCGQTCVKGVWKPDGRVEQICRCDCDRCKRERQAGKVADCPDGKCNR